MDSKLSGYETDVVEKVTRTVDVTHYYPSVIAPAKEFQELGRTENAEFSLIWDDFWAVMINGFVWCFSEAGAARWEKMLGITPSAGASLEARREAILFKINNQKPYTERYLQRTIASVYGEQVHVRCDYNKYTLYVDASAGARRDWYSLSRWLRGIIPANILPEFTLDLNPKFDEYADITLHIGIADCHLGRKRIRIPPPDDASIKARSGVGYFRTGRMRIGAGEEPPPSVLAQHVGVLAYRIGRVRIPYNPADKGQAHESRLYPAGAGYHTGLASLTYGRRHIGLSAPAEPESMSAIGMASATIGRKRIRSAAPPESYTEPRGGRVILRTGRITIQVSKEETTQ